MKSSSSQGRTTLEVGADGVAIITIINPPVNSLSFDVLYSLKDACEQALRTDDAQAVVVTDANGKFSGGFDISAFGKIQEKSVQAPKPGFVSLEILNDLLAAGKKPFVAAIDGLALGGGLEIPMACHARISTPTARLGLPELQLGVIPGFGGTQALPRLVGTAKALEMMLSSPCDATCRNYSDSEDVPSVKLLFYLSIVVLMSIRLIEQLPDLECGWVHSD